MWQLIHEKSGRNRRNEELKRSFVKVGGCGLSSRGYWHQCSDQTEWKIENILRNWFFNFEIWLPTLTCNRKTSFSTAIFCSSFIFDRIMSLSWGSEYRLLINRRLCRYTPLFVPTFVRTPLFELIFGHNSNSVLIKDL